MNEVKTLFLNENDGENLLHCPYCGDEYVHLRKPLTFSAGEGYDAKGVFGLDVRGDVHALLFEGECGHQWALAFGFHKGSTYFNLVPWKKEKEN